MIHHHIKRIIPIFAIIGLLSSCSQNDTQMLNSNLASSNTSAPYTGSVHIPQKKPYLMSFVSSHSVVNVSQTELVYNVYAGGLHALRASLELDMSDKKYNISLTAKTNGFIGKLFPWSGDYNTIGKLQSHDFIVSKHVALSQWKKKLKSTELNYTKSGVFKEKTTIKNHKTTIKKDIKPELTQGTFDMLTATLKILENSQINKSCQGSIPVFDGKRRFNITLQQLGNDTIKPSKYSIFSGTAMRCTLNVTPVAGFRKKDKKRGWMAIQNHTNKRNKAPTIWLASLGNSNVMVPVRMEIASDYGTVIAHLTQINRLNKK